MTNEPTITHYSIDNQVIPLLFGTWIKDTKTLQEQWYGKNFETFTHQELVEWVRINILAAEDELHEALAEISWKPWASAEFFHREAFLGEIVDVLHFIGNLLAGADITDYELNSAYSEKMERNRERQRSNYTGLDKCSVCTRAGDDVVAHGGSMVYTDSTWTCRACIDGVDS